MTMPANDTPSNDGLGALSEKEKQTLRLIVRGHDAKSVARSLGLSVHTINERLRDARRKMAVSSSREAARLLLEAERADASTPPPHFFGPQEIGEDRGHAGADGEIASIGDARRAPRPAWIITGVCLMSFVFGLLALVALPQAETPTPPSADATQAAAGSALVESARQWLVLVDQARWDESYRATGQAFRKLNTAKVWAATSEKVRVPLGAVLSRTFVSQENLPAPPAGYEVVKFRTSFAKKADALETVTLERETGGWHVVGVTIG